jgi:hypothetical protein
MQVTAEQTFVSASGERRGRICRRGDGLFQVVTESLAARNEESDPYWVNDYPASGILETRADAERYLRQLLPDATERAQLEPCTFQLDVGPYPEPVTRRSA